MFARSSRLAVALVLVLAPLASVSAKSLGDVGGDLLGTAKGVQKAGEDAVDTVADAGQDAYEAVASWKDAGPEALRQRKCSEAHGRWVTKLTMTPCVDGSTTITLDGDVYTQACGEAHQGGEEELQCVDFDAEGRIFFNDGPSVPPAIVTISGWLHDKIDQLRYEDILWQAGVDHDHCYHANPVTYGLSKADCDDRFIADLVALCESQSSMGEPWFDDDVCHSYVAIMYGAVRAGGGDSWKAFDTEVAYPRTGPMWEQLGLSEDPYTGSVKDDVDGLLIKFNIIDDPAKD